MQLSQGHAASRILQLHSWVIPPFLVAFKLVDKEEIVPSDD